MDTRTEHMLQILKKAQDTYGFSRQLNVAVEELLELGIVLQKYDRYQSHKQALNALHDRVVDEIADVVVILNHVFMIFSLSQEEIDKRVDAKVERLERWLNVSDSMYQTVLDREVHG